MNPKLSIVSTACAQALPLDTYDREPDIQSAIEQLLDQQFTGLKVGESGLTVTTAPVTYDLLRAVWGMGYETCERDGAVFLGAAGRTLRKAHDLLDRAAAQMAPSHHPSTRPEFDALTAFLQARDRKLDDGDALETYVQAEAVLTARLRISTDLEQIRESLTNKAEGQKRTGDYVGLKATRELLEMLKQKAPGL